MKITEFPAEYFIEIEGQPFLLGRLVINKMNTSFWVEIDIVQKESKKIWVHVSDLYGIAELDEAIDRSVQALADYFKSKVSNT